ncbi:MAG: peptidoglycan editing factor PgeF [Deltaproteobacteria bacterium]|nr:peptidoglycan editing factor PgeF [Deltaproteobacteria bacterium]
MSYIKDRLLSSFPGIDHGFGSVQTTCPEGTVLLRQRHTNTVVVIDSAAMGRLHAADAMLTDVPGIAIGIKTADCLPILLYDPAVQAVGAVHAGWRGLANKVILNSIDRLCTSYRTDTGHIYAAIGPAICSDCYEVGTEVVDSIGAVTEVKDAFRPTSPGKGFLDTAAIAMKQLQAVGVPPSHISHIDLCTRCSPGFHSYRAGSRGRQISYIMILPPLATHPAIYNTAEKHYS